MRWGLIFAVLVLAGCAADTYSERYAERPAPDIRRLSPIVYADEECPPPKPSPPIVAACAAGTPVSQNCNAPGSAAAAAALHAEWSRAGATTIAATDGDRGAVPSARCHRRCIGLQKACLRAAIFVQVAATECRPAPTRPRPLDLARRAAGTARRTGLSSRPASPSRTGQSPDLRATCHAPRQATVAPPLKATSRATTVGPHPRTLDLTRARANVHRARRHALALTKRNANARPKFRAVDAAVASLRLGRGSCPRRGRGALSVTPSADLGEPRRGRASPRPSMCCWRPEAPFAATMCHGPKTVGCPSRSWSSSAKPRQGATEHKHAKARRTASAAPPRCFHGAIRTRGVCRSQTDRVRRNAPLTRDAPRHRPSKAVAGWRDPGRPAPGLPGFAAARMKTRATGAPQRGSPRDPLFAVRAALLSTAVVSPASPAVAGLVLVTPPR